MSSIRLLLTKFKHYQRFRNNNNLKPFDYIPGPLRLPLIGSSWKYIPYIGDWDARRLHLVGAKRQKQYGSVVREELSPGVNCVHVYRPEDIKKVYTSEGKLPERNGHLALMHYRLNRPHLYSSGGLLPTNGEEWWRLRSTFQKYIARLQDARYFLSSSEEVIGEFVKTQISDNIVIQDILPSLSRLYFELMWQFIFGRGLNSFDPINIKEDSLPSKVIKAAETVTRMVMITDSTEKYWKVKKTKPYLEIEESFKCIERVVLHALKELEEDITKNKSKDENKKSLVEKFIQIPGVDRKDINCMTFDLVLGGVDTTAYTTSFLLYNIANNERVQEKLCREVTTLLPTKESKITPEVLNSALYTRAVLKESLRLNPVSVGISRILQQDTEFSGYLVPKGTLMLTQNLVACRSEDNFKDASVFKPERWIRGSSDYEDVSPYLVLPFSHGPRTCIARRLAEQNMLVIILSIVRFYSMTWEGDGELDIVTPLTCKPDKPVKLSFHRWKNLD